LPANVKVADSSERQIMKIELAAAVLCGGRGERLRPLTDYFQKAMIPLGERKRPLLEYIVRLLAFHHVRHITLLTSYRMEEIRSYFKDGAAFGVEIAYSRDPADGAGSLTALSNALRNGSVPECQTLVVYYGDILSDLDVTQFVKVHRDERADATLVLSKGYSLPVGVAKVQGRRVVAMEEKPRMNLNVTMGCMALGPSAMRIASTVGGKQKHDLMSDLIPTLLRRRLRVAAYYTKGLWHDIGTITTYEKVNSELKDDMLPFL
jgi:mannose-1-phosphate guanylyltransferase